MITLHLEAYSLDELRIAACSALGLKMPSAVGIIPTPDRPEKEQQAPEPQEPVQSDKPRRAHRRVRPIDSPVVPPVAAPAPDPDPLEEAIDQLTSEVDAESLDVDEDTGYTIDVGSVGNAVDNEMLKREVISSLSAMFTAGNVKVVRHVLHKYGRGAKSFPEIDPAHFPEIKAALDRNEAA